MQPLLTATWKGYLYRCQDQVSPTYPPSDVPPWEMDCPCVASLDTESKNNKTRFWENFKAFLQPIALDPPCCHLESVFCGQSPCLCWVGRCFPVDAAAFCLLSVSFWAGLWISADSAGSWAVDTVPALSLFPSLSCSLSLDRSPPYPPLLDSSFSAWQHLCGFQGEGDGVSLNINIFFALYPCDFFSGEGEMKGNDP